jgi:hypothetical protein
MMKVIETTGRIEKSGYLKLDKPIETFKKNQKVKVIILFDETESINDKEWLMTISNNPSFDYLKDEREDIYNVKDGIPIKRNKK